MTYHSTAALSCLLLWAAVGNAAPVYTNHVLYNTDPVIYWKLDEQSGTTAVDAAPGGPYNGTYGGTHTLPTAGPRPSDGFATMAAGNSAPSVQANGYTVYTGLNTTAGVSPGAYSVQVWFNSSMDQFTDRVVQYVFGRGDSSSSADFKEGVYVSGSNQSSAYAGKLVLFDGSAAVAIGDRTLSTNTWHHVVLTRDDTNVDSKVQVYLNGRLELEADNAWAGGVNGNHLTAAHRTDYHTGYGGLGLYGAYDEVAVWNRPLSEAEAKNLYLGALGSPYMASVLRKEPEAYWRLEETTGVNMARDSTDNGRAFNYTVSAGISRTGEGTDVGPRPAEFGGLPADNNAPTLDETRLGIVNNLLTGQNDYSAEMWFRPGDSNHYYGHYLLHRGTGDNNGDYLGVKTETNTLYFYDGTLSRGQVQLTNDQWYHVGIARQGNDVKVYLNGLEDISISRVANAGLTTGQWAFGGRGDSISSMNFTGNIDEIAVYGAALGGNNFQENYLSAMVNRDVPYAKTVLRYSPESYWRLDEVSPYTLAIDATGHGHTFTYHADASRTGSGTDVGPRGDQFPGLGPDNNAPTLNATRLGVADGLLAGQVDYTAQMWFRPGDSVHSYGHYLLHRGADGHNGDYLGVRDGTDTLYFFDGTRFDGSTVLEKGQWYHVATIRAGNNVTIYLNGQEEISVNRTPNAGLTNGDWAFGGRSEYTAMNFTGNIDEIALYGRALSKFHVQASYLSALPRDECDYSHAVLAGGPEAYWRLNEGPEWIAAMDSTGNAHHFEYHASVQRGNPGPRPSAHFLGFEQDNTAPRLTGGPLTAGDGYLGIVTDVLPGQNDYTAEMWFRPKTSTHWYGDYLLHRGGGGAKMGDFLGLTSPGAGQPYDRLYFYRDDVATFGDTILTMDDWYHVALVREGDMVSVFLNGRLEITETWAANDTSGQWAFGGRSDMPGQQKFAGSLDEIAIYGRVLSQEEIRAHYLVGVPEPSTWMLLALPGLSLAVRRRRQRRNT